MVFYLLLQESDNLWWDAFATEFFEDDATLTLTFCLEDGPKRYSKLRHRAQFFFHKRSTRFSIGTIRDSYRCTNYFLACVAEYAFLRRYLETWKTHLRSLATANEKILSLVGRFSFGTTPSSSRSIVLDDAPYV